MLKKRIAAVLAVTAMLVSAIPFSVSAHTNDTYFVVKVSSTTSVSIDSTAQKKDNTTSSYIRYSGKDVDGPRQWIATIWGASSSDAKSWTDCTTYYAGTSTKRSTAYITKGTKGYVRQDVRETYGRSAWARVGGKGCGYAATNAKAVWSPDSVAESGCIDYNG